MSDFLHFYDEYDDERPIAEPVENRGRRKNPAVDLPVILRTRNDDENGEVHGNNGVETDSAIDFTFMSVYQEGANGKRQLMRVQGGRAAAPKAINTQADDDDAMLVWMKNMGYSDKQVVDAFARDGRTVYSTTSITGRYTRVLRAQENEYDELLERELVEWTAEDDEELMKAYQKVNEEIYAAFKRIRDKRFRMVATAMRKEVPTSKYSAKACYDRYNGLVNGTACIPVDVHDEPERVKTERDARVAAAENERRKNLALEAAAIKKQEAQEATAKRLKEMRTVKAMDRKEERLKKETEMRLNKAAEAKAAMFAHHIKVRAARDKGKQVAADDEIGSDDDERVIDPREDMSVEDLRHLCKKKGINNRGKKLQMVNRLYVSDERMTIPALKARCREIGRPTGGTKDMLLYRIADHEARSYSKPIEKRRKKALSKAEKAQAQEDQELHDMFHKINAI
ncbi:hypothetical protein EJ05DRAFT_497860 [Pseudovirgaria hyperparasitica]|uniref:SAP domain-containing protein n=1 Tax=Pseudovirgaria hyperparasitica TaxID=470096 RepID=A0A6A6WEQ8_9PEZI|nr:uncharacterized protein EJ05DRAFT_497860 [Pseudovirgaria hyperparasitica]KAF2761308.1 hypothetical protein EJ05DRAFT_497860 [Pseudovirgaria hyperparasitica]